VRDTASVTVRTRESHFWPACCKLRSRREKGHAVRGSTRLDSAFVSVSVSLFALLVACDVGIAPVEGTGGGPDGGGSGSAPDPTGGNGGPDGGAPVEIACDDPVASNQSGEHNAGEPCLSCHGNGDGPDFTLGGTVYTSLAGGSPVVGATIRLTDANGAELTVVSARNGNFWIRDAIAFPIQVQASACPSTMPMVAPSSVGNCNASGCHDSDYRIYLPQ
jgi:hypothetical protein